EPDQDLQYNQGQTYGHHSESSPNEVDEARLNKIEDLLTRLLENEAQSQQRLAEHEIVLKNQQVVFASLQNVVEEISR
ncbi:hypothetical protein NL520_28620, partial [Klebsiella pneumoniae]|nr:hypothetical protein [Klebsiella pneumoniae]